MAPTSRPPPIAVGPDRLSQALADEFSLLDFDSRGGSVTGANDGESLTPSSARPSSTTSSSGGGAGNSLADQGVCVLVSKANLSKICWGVVGTKGRVCAAPVVDGSTNCGAKGHDRSKFSPVDGHIYPPGGSVRGKDTVLETPSLARDRLTISQLEQLTQEVHSSAWHVARLEFLAKEESPKAGAMRDDEDLDFPPFMDVG